MSFRDSEKAQCETNMIFLVHILHHLWRQAAPSVTWRALVKDQGRNFTVVAMLVQMQAQLDETKLHDIAQCVLGLLYHDVVLLPLGQHLCSMGFVLMKVSLRTCHGLASLCSWCCSINTLIVLDTREPCKPCASQLLAVHTPAMASDSDQPLGTVMRAIDDGTY